MVTSGGVGEESGTFPILPGGASKQAEDVPINLGQLRRSRSDKHVAGVAGGLAQLFDIDPIVVRVAFVVLAFFGGAGLLLYLGFWFFVPLEDDERTPFSMDDRSRSFALYLVLGLAVLVLLGATIGHFHAPWFVAVIAAIALLVLWRGRERQVPYVRVRRGWVEDEQHGRTGNAARGWVGEEPAAPAATPPAAGDASIAPAG